MSLYSIYSKDETVSQNGTTFGTRPLRRLPAEFGTNLIASGLGKFRQQRTNIINWYDRRHVKHARDQWYFSTLTHQRTFWGDDVRDEDTITAILHWLERGKTYLPTLFNFTVDVFERFPQLEQAYVTKQRTDRNLAAKNAIVDGLSSKNTGMMKWAVEHTERMLERLAPLAGKIEVEVWSEMHDWLPLDPFQESNKTFARTQGFDPVEKNPFDFLKPLIQSKFPIRENKGCHCYHDWNGERITQWYLGWTPTVGKWDATEMGVTSKSPNRVNEAKRLILDCWDRGAERIYWHTHALTFAPLKNYNNKFLFYSPYQNKEAARSLVTAAPNMEGAAMLDEDMDDTLTATAEIVGFGV